MGSASSTAQSVRTRHNLSMEQRLLDAQSDIVLSGVGHDIRWMADCRKRIVAFNSGLVPNCLTYPT